MTDLVLRRSLWLLTSVLIGVSAAVLLWGDTPFLTLWQGALSRLRGESFAWNALLDERLPRLIVLICTGASLAVSGGVMQTLFRNPLATPSILGITFGGSFCVVFIFLAEWHLRHPYAVSLAAFLGCIVTLSLVYNLSRRYTSHLSSLLLNGIAVTTVILAIQGALLYLWRDHWQFIQTVTEWAAGSTADRSWQHVHMQLPLTLVGIGGCWYYSREINILALGEEEALNLGVDVGTVRWRLFLAVALLTAGALAAVGVIAYFGMLLPHIVRKLHGPNAERLIPLCVLGGSAAFVGLELALRMSGAHVLSIGNVSAILGGIFFLVLLSRETREKETV